MGGSLSIRGIAYLVARRQVGGRAAGRAGRRRHPIGGFAGAPFMRPPGARLRDTPRSRWRRWSVLFAGLALLTLAPLLAYSQDRVSGVGGSALRGPGRPSAQSRTAIRHGGTVAPPAVVPIRVLNQSGNAPANFCPSPIARA